MKQRFWAIIKKRDIKFEIIESDYGLYEIFRMRKFAVTSLKEYSIPQHYKIVELKIEKRG